VATNSLENGRYHTHRGKILRHGPLREPARGASAANVAARVGHANVTLQIYSHFSQDKQNDTAVRLGDALFGVQ
jgi:hypothetical protein